MTYGIIPALEKPNIPNKIFDYTLSEKEKAELLKNGRLSKAITVTVSNQKKTIIPFIDKSTNQLLLCNVDKLKLPNQYKGVELSEKHKQELLKGHTVAVGGLLDNQGVPYNGYARINPANGKIEDIPVANLEHKRQVAANNFGERTDSLSRDKDTTIGRAQQKNNDAPKPKLKTPKMKRWRGQISKDEYAIISSEIFKRKHLYKNIRRIDFVYGRDNIYIVKLKANYDFDILYQLNFDTKEQLINKIINNYKKYERRKNRRATRGINSTRNNKSTNQIRQGRNYRKSL